MWLSMLLLAGLMAGFSIAQEVETEYGTVKGQTIPVQLSTGVFPVTSFWGIPFARPPIGDLRFEPPQKAQPWSGAFVADTLPNACIQSPVGVMYFTHPLWNKYSEDCLTLNIFAPANIVVPLPVMVWIHGGGYSAGANVQYPGHMLAARNVIVVTINYRLGVFGFASTPDGTIPGNMAMLDQVMALEFVRDNIAAFGGNPNSVTIFGESAGGTSTSLHLVSPKSKGLFHRAIIESGAENSIWAVNPPERKPDQYIIQVADRANCTTENTADMLQCLRDLPSNVLRLAAALIQCEPGYYCMGFIPVIDGPGGFMPDVPLTLLEQLGDNAVPILSGINRDDGALFTAAAFPGAGQGDGFTRVEFELNMYQTVDFYSPSLAPEQAEAAYNAMDFQYTPHPYLDNLWENRQAFNQYFTDAYFGYAWDRQVKVIQRNADTYAYVHAYISPNSTASIPEWQGVSHMTELSYVWGYGYLLINPLVRDDSGIYFDLIGWVEEDMIYADYMQTLWTNFAKYDNPTPSPVRAPFDNVTTTWPKFKMDDNLKVMYLDTAISTVELYRQKDYAFFTRYLGTMTDGRPSRRPKQGSAPLHSLFERSITSAVERMIKLRFPEPMSNEKIAEIRTNYNR